MISNKQLFDDWRKQIAAFSGDDEIQHLIKEINSKALLTELKISLDNRWNFVEPLMSRSARTLSFMTETMAMSDYDELEKSKLSILRLALLWENLARLKEKTDQNKALLNSAILYQLAGYQANSVCLARKIRTEVTENSIEGMFVLFLQRQFVKLKQVCDSIINDSVNVENQSQALVIMSKLMVATAFSELCNYFLMGDENSFDKSESVLVKLEQLFADLGLFEDFNMSRSIRSILPSMKKNSTWEILSKVFDNNFSWMRYLNLLARGTGNNLLYGFSVCELWPSQISALEKGLLSENFNKIIKMPTSAGKTRIAELVMAYTMIKDRTAKCVYVAPYRALVTELEDTFLNIFGDLGFRISSAIGSFETDPFEKDLVNEADILVVTPEKLDLLFRSEAEFLKSVKLFIFDEGHIINSRRGLKFELLLTRLKTELTTARFLFLSAVISEDTIKEFLQWFNQEQSKLIEDDWRPSIQRHAKFVWMGEKGKIIYEQPRENRLIDGFVPGVVSQKWYQYFDERNGKSKKEKFPSTTKSETAAELAYKFSELGPVLVFCPTPDLVQSTAKALKLRLMLTKQAELSLDAFFDSDVKSLIPKYFQEKNTRSLKISEDLFGSEHEITKLLRSGIAIHHGKLPDILRRAIELDFRDKKYQVIIATNTLAQGVNLPIRTVIIHSCRRDPRMGGTISVNDYWNIAGRAGRAGQETEGTIVHIVQTPQDEEDYKNYLEKQKQLEPIQSSLHKILEQLIAERISIDEVRNIIDPEILALLAEEDPEFIETKVKTILENSLVAQQAHSHQQSISLLLEAFQTVGKKIRDEIPNPHSWKIYSTTGLSAKSCQLLSNYIKEKEGLLRNLLTNSSNDIEEIFPLIIESMSMISEMAPKYEFVGDRTKLMIKWMRGESFNVIGKEFEIEDNLKLIKFIEEFFGYLMPWGIFGFLQIAKYVLDIDDSRIISTIKYLPSMIKFGVPTPEASWAMMIGIPFREAAMRISDKFRAEKPDGDYKEFRKWITLIDNDVLIYDYGLVSPFLEDVNKALTKSGLNPLLTPTLSKIENILSSPTWISGIKYEERRLVAYVAKEGDLLKIKRDYENRFDRNAIKVTLHERDLGYLNRNLAQFLSTYMDCGLQVSGKIIRIEKGAFPNIQISLHVIK